MKRCAAMLITAMMLTLVPARAAEDPRTYETILSGEGATPASHLSFFESCGEECYAASLDCDSEHSISFIFGDVEAKIAAAAITHGKQGFSIAIDGKAYSFFIMKLEYGGEMYSTWLVTGSLPGSNAEEFSTALGTATSFKATIGNKSLILPVMADVKTWAAACLK